MESVSCTTASETVGRIVRRSEVELANQALKGCVKKDVLTRVRLVAERRQKEGASGVAGTKLK